MLSRYKNIILYYLIKKIPQLIPAVKNPNRYTDFLKNKCGIEIGGPSDIFRDNNILPVYKNISSLDNCNFSGSTIWEGSLKEGLHFNYYKSKYGHQYIREASNLTGIANGAYDFLLSSHCLEHCANAILALNEWKRVVKKEGYLLIIVPDKDSTFDHKRPITPLSHFIQDFKSGIEENDLSHLEEILQFHDLSIDKRAGSKEQFKSRSLLNLENRCLHHHTFNKSNFSELISYAGLKIIEIEKKFPYHIICLAQKISD